ncbi:RHS repeat-associated core domain-containing protein [Amycolatopsis sp. NPDC051071]|uniref:RHS repeat-associated core domain-containing protein n=1 Tax=Amycolatopsis sp. NPDC051071 TaxID=3154637 RepID=UPI0034358EF3
MSNPLVAPVKDSTTAVSGVPLLEGALDLKSAIESGDWASVAMGAVGTALDAMTAVMDPFGTIFAAGVGWLIEHVGPLKDALDALAGNADEVAAQSQTWTNVAKELGTVSVELVDLVKKDLDSWKGEAADTYRKQAQNTSTLLESAQKGSEGAASGVKTAGEVVAAVRTLVRDIIAELVGHLISWALQVVFTLGIGLTWVVPQVVAAVAKTAIKIAGLTTKLVKALKGLVPLLKKAGDLFGDAGKALKNLKGGAVKPAGKPKSPGPKPKGGDKSRSNPDGDNDSTHTSGADGNHRGGGGESNTNSGGDKNNRGGEGNQGGEGGHGGGSQGGRGPDNGGTSSSSSNNPNKPDNPRDRGVGPDNRNYRSDPVDIATGEVVLTQIDLELTALRFERTHVSSYRAGRWFGPSWSSFADQRIEVDAEHVCYFSPDGMVLVYPLPSDARPVLPVEGPRWPLSLDADGTATVTDHRRGRTLRFGARRGEVLPLRAIEADGERVDVEYDEAGAPAVFRYSTGIVVGLRAERGRITELRVVGDQAGADVVVTRYHYNVSGHLSGVVNSSGLALLFDYDADGRLTGWQDRNGVWYRHVYDEHGRCVRAVGTDGFLDGAFDYDRARRVTTHTDSLGHRTVFQLNEANQTIGETDPLGHTTTFEWDRYDRLLSRTDALGHTTRYDYDDEGRVTRVTRPDGSVALLEHDGEALHSITVRDGDRYWRRFYDESAPDPLREPVGVATPVRLDAGQEPVPSSDDRDQFGRPRSVSDGSGPRTQLGWTVSGLPALRIRDGRDRAIWRYDGEDNEIEHVDELGRTSRSEYGPFDRLTATIDPAGGRTTYRYDTELRPVSVTNPNGLTWTYRYDARGLLVEQVDFDGRTSRYDYDAAGRLVRSVDLHGGSTEYRYDVLGNLVEVHAPTGSTWYAYDPVGEAVRVASADSVVEFVRDAYGRVVRETIDGRAVTFAYDTERNLIRRRTPSGAESEWFFDHEDRPIALVGSGHTVRYSYDDEGRPDGRMVDDAYLLQQSFGPDDRLVTQTVFTNDGPGRTRTFDYSPDGRLAATWDPIAGRTTFSRDALGRLTTVTSTGLREDFAYDTASNLVAGTSTGGWPADAEAGPRFYERNTVKAAGAVTYEHDPLGRRVLRREQHPNGERVWHYVWDAANRLIGVATPDGGRWRYRYDPLGRRIAKHRLGQDGGVAESLEFAWDGDVMIEQVHIDPSGAGHVITWDRHPGSGEPVTQRERGPGGEGFHSVVTDAVGTPLELLDSDGEMAWYGRKTLWGRHLPSAGAKTRTPLRFPGQYADDETGLHYNVHRYYDPATARYLSQDPLGLEAGPNPVAYPGDPYAHSDPLGLMDCGGSGASKPPGTPGGGHNAGNTGGSGKKPKPPVPDRNKKPKPPEPDGGKKPKPPVPDRNKKPNYPPAQPNNGAPTPAPGKQDFVAPNPPRKFKRMEVLGTYNYNPNQQKLPGTGFTDIIPMQNHVSTKIVDGKIKDWKANGEMNTPVKVPVYYPPNNPNQLSLMGDKHHTLVAAVQSGRPVELNLVKPPGGVGMANPRTNWNDTKWSDFELGEAWRQ